MRRPASGRRYARSDWRSATRRASSRKASPQRARASPRRSTSLRAALDRLAAELTLFAERSEELGNCARRATEAAAALARWRNTGPVADVEGGPPKEWIRWVDVTNQGWQLLASPLSIADTFSKQVAESGRAWIFTSATLAVGRDFSLYQSELGLADAATGCWESPFDYDTQALLYVPRDLPPPNSREHTEAVVAAALPVLKASGGRAFLLFTTHRALNDARAMLADCLRPRGPRLAAAGAGRRVAQRAARALSRARQRGAARQPELLGRRRRCRATRCRSSSSTSCRSRRPTIRCSPRGSSICGPPAAIRSSTTSCRRR